MLPPKILQSTSRIIYLKDIYLAILCNAVRGQCVSTTAAYRSLDEDVTVAAKAAQVICPMHFPFLRNISLKFSKQMKHSSEILLT